MGDNFEWAQGYHVRFGVTYTDYVLGFDPNANGEYASQQPTPGHQVRRRKDSSCWLEAVWTANALVDIKGPAFTGCVSSYVFDGNFTESLLPSCTRMIRVNVDGTTGTVICGLGCLGDSCYGTHAAKFSGGTIIAKFGSLGGVTGGERSTGYWNRV